MWPFKKKVVVEETAPAAPKPGRLKVVTNTTTWYVPSEEQDIDKALVKVLSILQDAPEKWGWVAIEGLLVKATDVQSVTWNYET